MYRIIQLFALTFCINLSFTYGQTTTPFETWSVVEVGYDVGKKIDIKANYQLRHSYSDSTRLERHFGEFGASYKIIKGLKVGSVFRIGKDRRKQTFNPFNRIAFFTQYDHDIKRWNLKYKIQWQHQTKTVKEKARIVDKLRLRFQTDYNIRKWKFDPTFAVEYFIANKELTEYQGEKFRFTLGTQREIIKNLVVKGAYRMEFGTGVEPENLAIAQLELSYSF